MNPIKIYKLKKEINSPQFTRTIEAGRIYTQSQMKAYLNITPTSQTFNDWFEDVTDEYEIKGCRILKKGDTKIVKTTAYFVMA